MKQVRHTIVKAPKAGATARYAGKATAVTHRATGRTAPKIIRPVLHRTASTRPALRAAASSVAHPSKITRSTTKITPAATKIASRSHGLTAGVAKTAAAKGKAVTTTTATAQAGTAATAAHQVSGSATILNALLQPVTQSVLGTSSQLAQHATTVLARTADAMSPGIGAVGHLLKPDLGTAGLTGSPGGASTSHMSSSAGSGDAEAAGTTGASSSNAGTDSPGSRSVALAELVRDVSGALLKTGAPTGGTVTAGALLTLAVGIAVTGAGSVGSGGSASVGLALLESILVPVSAGSFRRFAGAGRQVGWRLPGRPSFSPD